MGATKLKIGALDAALVFRADGVIEGMLPRTRSDWQKPNAVLAQLLLWAAGRVDVLEHMAKTN